MPDLRLTLPLPPSTNHSHTNIVTKAGRHMRVPNATAKKYRHDAQVEAKRAVCATGWTCTQEQRVVVELTVYWPDRRRRDCDNIIKQTLDSCTGILWDDDKWCLPRVMDFSFDKGNPRVEVVVRRMG